MEASNGFDEETGKRPVFLTVLCILTFVGSSLFILRNAMIYSQANYLAGVYSKARTDVAREASRADSAELRDTTGGKRHRRRTVAVNIMNSFSGMATAGSIRKNAAWTILSSLVTLLGAVLMWRQLRAGFFLYLLGTVVGIAIPFALYGYGANSVAVAVFSQGIGVLFVVLYALHYRSFR